MKTSVIEVRDMLSVLSVLGVEKRIGEVPGVESVTVNYAAGSATVRYDETRLDVADIKSAVRQSGYESAAPAAASAGDGHEGHTQRGAVDRHAGRNQLDATLGLRPSQLREGRTTVAAAPKPSPAAAPTSAAPKSAPERLPPRPRAPLQATDNKTKRRRTKVRTTLVLRSCL